MEMAKKTKRVLTYLIFTVSMISMLFITACKTEDSPSNDSKKLFSVTGAVDGKGRIEVVEEATDIALAKKKVKAGTLVKATGIAQSGNYQLLDFFFDPPEVEIEDKMLEDGEVIFVMPASNVTVTARFVPKTTQVVNITKGNMTGDGDLYISQEKAVAGDVVTIRVIPDPDMKFYAWTGTTAALIPLITPVDGKEDEYTFTVTTAVTIAAEFIAVEIEKLPISKGSPENGSIAIDKEEEIPGKTVTITLTPAADYMLDQWLNSPALTISGGTANKYTFPMPESPVQVNASFKRITYTINKAQVTGGTFTLVPEQDAYLPDTSITLTVTPGDGYAFNKWTVAPATVVITKESDTQYTFKVPRANITNLRPQWTQLPTARVQKPTEHDFKFSNAANDRSFEWDRTGNGTGGDAQAHLFDGDGYKIPYVVDMIVYIYDNAAAAAAATPEAPGGVGKFRVQGVNLIVIDENGTAVKVIDSKAQGGDGGGWSNPGNYYLQAPYVAKFLKNVLGDNYHVDSNNAYYLRLMFVAAGTNRAFDNLGDHYPARAWPGGNYAAVQNPSPY